MSFSLQEWKDNEAAGIDQQSLQQQIVPTYCIFCQLVTVLPKQFVNKKNIFFTLFGSWTIV